MHFTRARNQVNSQFTRFTDACSSWQFARLPIAALSCVLATSIPAWCQDSGSKQNERFGNGAEISVTVHDGSGEPISSPVLVRLYREGSILSGQGSTIQKDISVPVEGKTQVDVYLRASAVGNAVGIPGKPILAPKAQEAFDRGLRALGADKLRDAEKFVGEAVRLAPGHPDVLYAQGVLYLKQQDWTQAQSALEKATQVDPNHARAFAALGMAFSDQGKYEAAIAPLEKSLQLDSASDFQTHWVLAKAYYQSGRYDDALKSSQTAL